MFNRREDVFKEFWNDKLDSDIFRRKGGFSNLRNDTLVPETFYPRFKRKLIPHFTSELNRNDDDKFVFKVDIQPFESKDIEVKILEDTIQIEAHYKETEQNNDTTSLCKFTKLYKIPEGVDKDNVSSSLTANYLLLIECPLKTAKVPPKRERVIPVQIQTSRKYERQTTSHTEVSTETSESKEKFK